MRYITIPHDIALVNVRTKAVLPEPPKNFLDVAYDLWFDDIDVNKGGPVQLRRWMKMVDAFAVSKPGDVVVVDEAEWLKLKGIVENPKKAHPPLTGVQLMAFFEAILNAPETDPKVVGP